MNNNRKTDKYTCEEISNLLYLRLYSSMMYKNEKERNTEQINVTIRNHTFNYMLGQI